MPSAIFDSPINTPLHRRPVLRRSGSHKQVPLVAIPGFDLRRVVGTGGMGVVYEAHDQRLDRIVAVKLLHSGGFADPQGAERFRFEAQVVARLRHPHIVQPHQFGEVDGAAYLVMEYVDGPNLHAAAGGQPVPPAVAAAVVRAAAEGVGFAHRNGVVHRDLKPANILLTGADLSGQVRVTDFGMARLMADNTAFSQDGTVAGTPGYMAPEQCVLTGEVGPWTDVYSLGVVLYELLTGRLPVPSEPAELYLGLVQKATPLAPRHFQPGVPADLESVCLKCLAKSPPDRYLTADALADDLGRFAAGQPVSARRLGVTAAAVRAARRYPFVAALVVSTVVSLGAGTTASTKLYRQAEARRREAEAARREAEVAADLSERNLKDAEFVRDYVFRGLLTAACRNGDKPAAVAAMHTLHRDGAERFAADPNTLNRLHFLIGQRLRRLYERAAAEACFRAVLTAHPPASANHRAIAGYELALVLLTQGRTEDAVRAGESALAEAETAAGPNAQTSANLRSLVRFARLMQTDTARAAEVAAQVLEFRPLDHPYREGWLELLAVTTRDPGGAAGGAAAAWRP